MARGDTVDSDIVTSVMDRQHARELRGARFSYCIGNIMRHAGAFAING